MDIEERLEEYKTRYRQASLPEDVRQPYEQILAFVDAGMDAGTTADFTGELAGQLECKLDVFFPVAKEEDQVDPIELVTRQHPEDLREVLRTYKRLEGDVLEAILERIPGEGDETLCVFPAPFQLTAGEPPDPSKLGDVLETLLGKFLHPTLLLRRPPHMPSEDLFQHVVVAASSMHNMMRLVRCTVGLCPDGSTINLVSVADQRFMNSMHELLKHSEEFDLDKTETKLRSTLIEGMERRLRQVKKRLGEDYDMTVDFETYEGTIEQAASACRFFEQKPTLLAVPLHYTGGGYDTASLRPLFRQYTSAEILTL